MTDQLSTSLDSRDTQNWKKTICSDKAGEVVHVITHNDILCGRGSGPNDHPGNVNFRQIVSTRRNEYLTTSTRTEKVRIANEILNAVKSLHPPGRFLEKVENEPKDKNNTTKWITVSEHKATEKVKQALRQMRHRKSESDKLDYNSNLNSFNCRYVHRRAQSAPETVMAHNFQMQEERRYHKEPYSPGSVLSYDGSYQAQYYHYPVNHRAYLGHPVLTNGTSSYNFNGTCQNLIPPPPPPRLPPPPSQLPQMTTRIVCTPSPPLVSAPVSSPIQSKTFANTDPKHCSDKTDEVASDLSHKMQEFSLKLPMKMTNSHSESSSTTVFKPEPARFIYPNSSVTTTGKKHDEQKKEGHNDDSRKFTKLCHLSSSSIGDSLSLFESNDSSVLMFPLTMEDLDDDGEHFDLAAVTAIDEKQSPKRNDSKKCSRSSHYISTNTQEISSRNLDVCDDFWSDDIIGEPELNKYGRSREIQHKANCERSQHSLDDLSAFSLDEMSAQAGAIMMEILNSDSSLSHQEKETSLDPEQNNFDRMVMSVTENFGNSEKN